ncbi:MAG TPA: DNA-directed RNA polymerase subunit alpha [Spirochaetota bacterium]|nr:DNA-directed RNA polymerase subunit alpha [Spirochaetota bacterium]
MVESKLVTQFKRPKNVNYKQVELNKNTGIFQAKPYERGFATTIGNSLRRTLLSSLQGYAVVAVKFSKINNEFQNIKGVFQDTTEILLNFKKVAVRLLDKEKQSRVLHFDIKGKKDFHAKDLALDSNIKIGNPDFLIFNSNKEANFKMDVQIDYGRGYIPSSFFADSIETKGAIPIDADFSPVEKVTFNVGSVRVNNRSNYEELNMEITTRGVITPEEALREGAQLLKELYFTFNSVDTTVMTAAIDDKHEKQKDEQLKIFYDSVLTIPFAVRTHFFLKINDIREIGQLVTKTDSELQNKKKFTEGVLEDIKEKLKEQNLSLGMKNINYVQKAV